MILYIFGVLAVGGAIFADHYKHHPEFKAKLKEAKDKAKDNLMEFVHTIFYREPKEEKYRNSFDRALDQSFNSIIRDRIDRTRQTLEETKKRMESYPRNFGSIADLPPIPKMPKLDSLRGRKPSPPPPPPKRQTAKKKTTTKKVVTQKNPVVDYVEKAQKLHEDVLAKMHHDRQQQFTDRVAKLANVENVTVTHDNGTLMTRVDWTEGGQKKSMSFNANNFSGEHTTMAHYIAERILSARGSQPNQTET